jgi:signal transduction histidine kinase/ActR/RegA family two-component response regulator
MSPAAELLALLIQYRADALVVAVLTGVACLVCRGYVRQRGASRELSDVTCATVLAIAVAGALLAEWTSLVLGYPASGPITTVAFARGAVLTASALVSAVLLIAAARLALLRAELRVHADAGRQLEQARREADEANRAKSDFLAVMSHEIRTPLNAVMGFANLLAESRLDEAQRGYVTTITTEGARLGALINDILDLTKIEKGRLILERLPFAPAEIVHEVLRLLGPRAMEKNVDLRCEAQLAGPLLVAGDPLRFRQIIVNLVDNALKFTHRGSVTVFLAWTPPVSAAQPGQLEVRVRDTGIGIPPERMKALFQMFTQADPSTSRRYGGTGLGLAICQRLVALMGGQIQARSAPDEGSEFSFVLPMAPFSLPGENSAAADVAAAGEHPPRVLVVDDLETNRTLLDLFLRRHGFEPQVAAGGGEAVRLATENRYDAILLDLQMPDVDGYTAAQRIRSAETAGRRTPIIALTASLTRGTRERCLAAGMDDQLTKPLDLQKFRLLVKALASGPEPHAA